MESGEQSNQAPQRETTGGAKEESKEDPKLNINVIQPESKKDKPQTKEDEMSYDEYINSLEDDEKNKVKEIFELFDKNLDGGVDMKELKFILNSLDIYPNHDELSAMMAEADVANKGYINENDFKYIIAKQKKEYRDKLMKEAKDAFIALGGDPDLHTKISTGKIQEILRKEFELSEELEITLKKIAQDKEDISFEDFMKFFQ
jgi:Ca2+-binding EF-hand superfamily protein